MGCHSGDAAKVARRCWESADAPPPEWKVPQVSERFRYYRYGEFVFVYGKAKSLYVREQFPPDTRFLITIAGPFGNGRVWEKDSDE